MKNTQHQQLLDLVDFAIAEHEMVYDNNGNPIDYRYLYVNQAFCDLMQKTEEQMVGALSYEVFPHIEKTWLSTYQEVVETGKEIRFTSYTKEVDRYFNVFAVKTGENQFLTTFRDITSYVQSMSPTMQMNMVSNVFGDGKSAYFEFDLKNKEFHYSPQLKDIIGMDIVTYEDYVNIFDEHVHPNDRDRLKRRQKEVFDGKSEQFTMQFRFLHQKDNQYRWLSFFVFVDKRYRGVPIKLRGLVQDIDEKKQEELAQERRERLFNETQKVANIATFVFDLQTMKYQWSKQLDEFTGVDQLTKLQQFRDIVHPDDIADFDYSTNEIISSKAGITSTYRICMDEEIRYIQSSIFAEQDVDGELKLVYGILQDITAQEQSRQEIEYFANHDVLTGLYNRNNFEQTMKETSEHNAMTLLICDVDGLKLINDAFGHLEGDKLLVHLADILRDVAGENHIYRIGGDEFIVAFDNIDEVDMKSIETTIKQAVRRFRIYGVGFDVSIGYASVSENQSVEDAFRRAENLMYRRKLTERKSRKSSALNTIMQTMHERTEETQEHCLRVGDLAIKLMRAIGRKRDYELEEIRLVANVHDIGKISIADDILLKPSTLTESEYEAIKYHSESGYKIISNIVDNEDIAIGVLYHHERYDGTGYPHGLVGQDIPLYSRIIAIADAYDSMIMTRSYSPAKTKAEAINELKEYSGTQFDPKLVDAFVTMMKE